MCQIITHYAVCIFAHHLAQLLGDDRQFLTYQKLYRQSEIDMQVLAKLSHLPLRLN